jgi:hypothetical protein
MQYITVLPPINSLYSSGFHRIQIHCSHIEDIHQSVLALQHTTFCLDKHNFWHYALVINPLNDYFVLSNLK